MIRAPLLASAVAEKLGPLEAPWEVYAERARRYEVQLRGAQVETVRGPLRLEGYGIRVLRDVEEQTGVGFQASSDFAVPSVRAAAEAAHSVAKFNRFPARHPELPAQAAGALANPAILDPDLWSDPSGTLQRETAALLSAADARRLAPPTFAKIRATLIESSIANSQGLAASYAHTAVEWELAVKSEGGPEGSPPGEFWVDRIDRRARMEQLESQLGDWYRFAEDARHASPPPLGAATVVLPSEVLSGILPLVLGFQFSAGAALRGLQVPAGTVVGPETLHVTDEGLLDWAVGSSPFDDEGTPQGVRHLVAQGKALETVNDVLHAKALGGTPTGNALREGFSPVGNYWQKFTRLPSPAATTVVIAPGDGGQDEELVEGLEDGIWVQQLGWANPDVVSGTFGGEVRIGYRIRQGKLAEPVRGGTVGGPVLTRDGRPSMLNGILTTGSDPRRFGGLVSPALVVQGLTVSGEN